MKMTNRQIKDRIKIERDYIDKSLKMLTRKINQQAPDLSLSMLDNLKAEVLRSEGRIRELEQQLTLEQD